ncbi:MAG: CidA/LrgA family protein [Paraglaciecola sp.]|uniref:CidA/LrgA family protein n=1 Tax=Paraglaciecola sp. TaxID=1920173 RepID=UPI00326742C9
MIKSRTAAVFKLTLSCAALILIWLLGARLSVYIALPPALLGLFILFVVLAFLGRVPKALFELSHYLLGHFSLFFIPPIIAAWVYIKTLQQNLWLFLLAILFSTFLSMLITSWLARCLLPADGTKNDANKETNNDN